MNLSIKKKKNSYFKQLEIMRKKGKTFYIPTKFLRNTNGAFMEVIILMTPGNSADSIHQEEKEKEVKKKKEQRLAFV